MVFEVSNIWEILRGRDGERPGYYRLIAPDGTVFPGISYLIFGLKVPGPFRPKIR
jgi:hypothetical protein